MNKFEIVITIILSMTFVAVWSWGIWKAFTQGDDKIARFGRRIIFKK